MTRLRLRALAVVVLATAMGACAGDGPTGPGDEPLELSQVLGEMSVPDISTATAPMMPVRVGAPALPGISTAGCSFVAASGDFVCAPVTHGGLTITRTFTLIGADGAHLSVPDKAKVASIHMITTVNGTLSMTGGSGSPSTLTIRDRQDLTLSGLLTGSRTLDGTGESHVEGALPMSGSLSSMTMDSRQTISRLVLPDPRSGKHYPSSGTITADVDTRIEGGTGSLRSTVHSEMVFHPDGKAVITFTSGGVTGQCTIDLAAQGPPTCTM